MDNEGLLEWAEYEVKGAWTGLTRAESHRDELRKVVKREKDKEAYDIDALTLKVCNILDQVTTRIEGRNEFEIVYEISKEDSRKVDMSVDVQKAFWARCGVPEEELNGA